MTEAELLMQTKAQMLERTVTVPVLFLDAMVSEFVWGAQEHGVAAPLIHKSFHHLLDELGVTGPGREEALRVLNLLAPLAVSPMAVPE